MIFKTDGNLLYATGTIWPGDGLRFMSYVSDIERNYHDITLRLHTDGGSVFDGNLIWNAIQNSKSKITIEVIGIAASMGALLTTGSNDVYMVENGHLMIHAPSGYTEGTAKEHEETARLLRSIEANFKKKLIKRTGKDAEYVDGLMIGDHWYDAESALAEGLIKGIIEPQIDIETFNPESVGVKESFSRFAALMVHPTGTKTQVDFLNMKKMLIAALGLIGVSEDSSDTAVVEAVQKLMSSTENDLKKQINDLTAAKDKAEGELTSQKKEAITGMLAGIKLTDEEKKTYENIGLTSGIAALQTVLNRSNQPQAPHIAGSIQGVKAPENRADWDFDRWQKEDPKGLEVLAENDPEAFNALYNQKYQK